MKVKCEDLALSTPGKSPKPRLVSKGPFIYYVYKGMGRWMDLKNYQFPDGQYCIGTDLTHFKWVGGSEKSKIMLT